MMAKKKKGPAADALAQLEALEAEMEPAPVAVEERPTLPAKKKKKKKKGPKGAAADALAQLEELEAEGKNHHLLLSCAFSAFPLWAPSEAHNSSCRARLKIGVKFYMLGPRTRAATGRWHPFKLSAHPCCTAL